MEASLVSCLPSSALGRERAIERERGRAKGGRGEGEREREREREREGGRGWVGCKDSEREGDIDKV